jgi:hypothetical protein
LDEPGDDLDMEETYKALASDKKTTNRPEKKLWFVLSREVDKFLNGGYLINHLEPLGHRKDA